MQDTKGSVGLGCLIALVTMPISTVLRGYVLSVLWAWFIVPQFDVKPLGIVSAIGVALVVGWLAKDTAPSPVKDKKPFLETIVEGVFLSIAMPLMILFTGYIVHLFM